eukprot:2909582-Rhodomonas_salina.1
MAERWQSWTKRTKEVGNQEEERGTTWWLMTAHTQGIFQLAHTGSSRQCLLTMRWGGVEDTCAVPGVRPRGWILVRSAAAAPALCPKHTPQNTQSRSINQRHPRGNSSSGTLHKAFTCEDTMRGRWTRQSQTEERRGTQGTIFRLQHARESRTSSN